LLTCGSHRAIEISGLDFLGSIGAGKIFLASKIFRGALNW
jgi:hypothetical protein